MEWFTLIDKQEYYHGVVIVRLLDDHRFRSVSKSEGCYLCNEGVLVNIKYSTKNRSPWSFSFSPDELRRIEHLAASGTAIVIALVCGGDGVCALELEELREIGVASEGAITVRRGFRRLFSVSGPVGSLEHKISHSRLNDLVFART